MVDFTTPYDQYDFEDETRDRQSSPSSARKLASAKRELTGQQRSSTRARFSRPKGNKNGLSGAHRRRSKRSLV